MKYLNSSELYKYLSVGILTVSIDYFSIYLFYSVIGINYIIAVTIGFLSSNFFQFYSNFYFTFQLNKDELMKVRIIIFWIAVLIGNLIALLVIIFFNNLFDNVFLSKTLSLPLSFIYGFLVSKKVIYNHKFYEYIKQKFLSK